MRVDPNKDCAWEKIYQRLAKQGRLEEFLNQPVQVRDFSKVNFKVINDYVKSIREEDWTDITAVFIRQNVRNSVSISL